MGRGFLGSPAEPYSSLRKRWQGWGAAPWTSAFGSAVRAVSASRYPSVPSTNPRDSGNHACEKTSQRELRRNTPAGVLPLPLASQGFSWAAENNSSDNNNTTFSLIFPLKQRKGEGGLWADLQNRPVPFQLVLIKLKIPPLPAVLASRDVTPAEEGGWVEARFRLVFH